MESEKKLPRATEKSGNLNIFIDCKNRTLRISASGSEVWGLVLLGGILAMPYIIHEIKGCNQ